MVCEGVAIGLKIGILALQGSVEEHARSLTRLGVEIVMIRRPEAVFEVDGMILPGGESTTLGKLTKKYGIDRAIVERALEGMPIYGTCAGMILMAKEISSGEPAHLGLMDLTVTRNASGRQVDSYEAELPIPEIGDKPFRAVFIRAPYIDRTGGKVETLAKVGDNPVFARQGNLLASSFHPELTDDDRIHALFLESVKAYTEGKTSRV